jgi:hypothetical protein
MDCTRSATMIDCVPKMGLYPSQIPDMTNTQCMLLDNYLVRRRSRCRWRISARLDRRLQPVACRDRFSDSKWAQMMWKRSSFVVRSVDKEYISYDREFPVRRRFSRSGKL